MYRLKLYHEDLVDLLITGYSTNMKSPYLTPIVHTYIIIYIYIII